MIDLYTRMVVGWAIADHMHATLVVDTLRMARDGGYLTPKAVFHSDRGNQYTSDEFARWCTRNDVVRSMGGTGVCFDNAAAESWFATMKNEMYYRHWFPSHACARHAVAEYIELFYNRKRHHSTLDYRTPVQAWNDYYPPPTRHDQQLLAVSEMLDTLQPTEGHEQDSSYTTYMNLTPRIAGREEGPVSPCRLKQPDDRAGRDY